MTPAVEQLVSMAEAAGATVVRSAGAIVLVLPTAVASDPEQLLPLAHAAGIAATSVRVLREAIYARTLPAFGRERDRAVRRADLDKWIESRRLKPTIGPVDADMDRRVERLARKKKRSVPTSTDAPRGRGVTRIRHPADSNGGVRREA